ncbi:phenylacetate--CoA ligase family protein [Subsaximicrobium wynnwilliamsii]|uniref:Phenylacetate--CoA ligase family protein n=1 Tax=Subsaximicrobium wynnwilliamsii TaxID=291179 RepID=A0A5C6ZLY2_9FLAO|nr:phenylacetate--CoA ligase family protein [Subsaximicrobium wynnwilliamsii]TXD83944.1 phenylacetate--CoA ligase family protein [Subsaximicrobium wynnwilliamsii]TXD89684.1 phenylacetate--CoA ligase family protein [Subsaximicrobium wynnwilliamsii]TXE01669.1 phenylacetate--CoA ligase family protein [Subsaximicrobium wynnwilliamsii]
MNLFDLTLKLNGFPLKAAKEALVAIHQKNEIDFAASLKAKKKAILAHHLKYNAYYRDFVSDANVSTWEQLPVMTKRDLQVPLKQRLSEGYSTASVYVNKTSGSSGDPFVFAKDKFCHALTWAVIQDRFSWYGLDFNHSKQARFYGIPLDKKGYYKERIKDYFGNRFRFSVFDLSDAAFEKCLHQFRTTAFDYINGYTSAIVQFAKYLQRRDIILKDLCPSLNVCVVTSEMLFEQDKILLESQLGLPIVNEYGASELDLIAFQNPNDQWQVNSESLFVEILDPNNQVLPYGEEGRIVISSLYNKAHPFIRYDIGDLGSLSKDSSTKKPILQKLVGRSNDIVLLPSGKQAAGLTFYYITKSIIENDGKVKEFVIEQHQIDQFKVAYVGTEILSEAQQQNIIKAMTRYLEPGLTVIFERQEQLQRSKSGKLKQFTSLLNQDKA